MPLWILESGEEETSSGPVFSAVLNEHWEKGGGTGVRQGDREMISGTNFTSVACCRQSSLQHYRTTKDQ